VHKNAGLLWLALTVAWISAGCVTKSQADARARMAFLEGQNQALLRLHANAQPNVPPTIAIGPGVTFVGPVQNAAVPWRIGLTLAQAIVIAQYTGANDPTAIIIHRGGEDIPVQPKRLLDGDDFSLQLDDVIEIKP
jgi:hypothetical protein